MSSSGPLFCLRTLPLVSRMLAAQRIDVRPLLEKAGLPSQALAGEITAPLTRIQAFLDRTAELSERPFLGIDLAEVVPSGAMGVVEFLMRAAGTVAQSLETLCLFGPLLNPCQQYRVYPAGDVSRLHLWVPSRTDVLGRHLNEYALTLLIRQFSRVLGEPWPVREVWFAHRRPAGEDLKIAARLGCAVRFGAADCGFSLPPEALTKKPPTADSALFDFLHEQARSQLANVGTQDVIAQVSRAVEMRLASGDVSAAGTASAMATTVRSLQRALRQAGTSYRDVVTHVRRRRHTELSRGGLSEDEIAKRLGFSGRHAMQRALAQ
jgi:AraC-like DNA-binding protein